MLEYVVVSFLFFHFYSKFLHILREIHMITFVQFAAWNLVSSLWEVLGHNDRVVASSAKIEIVIMEKYDQFFIPILQCKKVANMEFVIFPHSNYSLRVASSLFIRFLQFFAIPMCAIGDKIPKAIREHILKILTLRPKMSFACLHKFRSQSTTKSPSRCLPKLGVLMKME